MNIRNVSYEINDREITILETGKIKPIKVQVKTVKGVVGKVNLKFYEANFKGPSTIIAI